ncbi:uncharacterized protein LOC125041980 [Penaeus chinensis]|uniref:uncharacterized protein LOC125041980 n=1 Tax=Penaeus chinensis TaxID=139456 RepID=UPI001FB7BB59|nr:uncharacterized protein LOC125041980 [Penaeus chinensis]
MDKYVTSVNLSNVMYSFACAQQCNWNSCCRLACQTGPMCEIYETKVAGHWAGTDDPVALTFDTCITKWVTNPRSVPPIKTSASSTSQGSDTRKAVDGFIGRNVSHCFSSGQEPNPWWVADLGGVKRVSQVRIHTRQDGLESQFLSVLVRLGNSSDPLAVSNESCLFSSLDQDDPGSFEGNSTNLGNATDIGNTTVPGNSTDPPGNTVDPSANTTDPPGNTTDSLGSTTDPPGNTTDPPGNTTDPAGISTEQGHSTGNPTNLQNSTDAGAYGGSTTDPLGASTDPASSADQTISTTQGLRKRRKRNAVSPTTSTHSETTESFDTTSGNATDTEINTSTASPDLGPQCETSNETKNHVFRLNPVIGFNSGEAPLAAEVVFSLPRAVSGRYLSIQSLESDPNNVLTICNVEVLEQQREPVMRNCLDVRNRVSKQSGVYTIYPHSCCPVEVICDMDTDGGGWTVIQQRQDVLPRQDFYRPWHDYVIGFGQKPCGEFWLGLEHTHVLTSQTPNQLRILLEDFDGAKRWANYGYFHVGDEATSYTLTVANYTGDAGDSLTYHNGQKFSTKDRDLDTYAYNCAERYRGAWWYRSCLYSGLNGEYLAGRHSYVYQGVYWLTWRGAYYSLKTATMMIRPAI